MKIEEEGAMAQALSRPIAILRAKKCLRLKMPKFKFIIWSLLLAALAGALAYLMQMPIMAK